MKWLLGTLIVLVITLAVYSLSPSKLGRGLRSAPWMLLILVPWGVWDWVRTKDDEDKPE